VSKLVYKDEVKKLKKFKTDFDWFQANYEEIKKYHKGDYVAIKDEEIIDYDKSAYALIRRLKQRYGKASTSMLVEPIIERKSIYVL
jgi:hypothetical protein